MAPTTHTHPTPFPSLPGYEIVEQLYAGSRTRVYRAVEESSQRPVILKFLQQEYPTFDDLLHFRNQYTIAKALNLPGVIRPYSLEPYGNSYVLVMEDIGGLSLHDYARQSALSVSEVLTIALQLTEILHDLHQQRVIYKDLKPANILIQPTSKQVKLIDFSIASLLPRETQEIQNPNSLEGTLAYLSPEQTGRMNRGIDYRSDFYAFGATLYELLTGQLPFQSDDPMELVYSHLAKVPSAPHELNPEIPITVSEIVLKLMAKNAEDRYQSALGLKYDLETCLHQLKEIGTVIPFEIGTRDR
ncbi:serine/threonine protein kinase with two-component sensor domain [Leptolyngbya boryana NIES-2135]|jgi:serine/threonine protein kinase|uniref:non-specific serine/threonine protein kinase n=1 Tax=Leptolyngbya boryana NIES-2135 TaxID=1973484 RepID=A0A1Z4JCQ4_LEPBY|nr:MULTISPECIES: serine/threonine-protein kinase [Leptolyngbya]BAY54247.1 serine/threonine protein kinase with two-component sensor domain [Leptolyngbya boryana NIES-2135]MBD2370306.1 serine/threonine protein kinase [Leptolyngbya sp. FACHB-161]MBD2407568.1 serine/threonine protein kinase [Leptolyngbya sp. FACHB-402]ULP31180.1 serine/threonine protein kinase [Leptolyngbya boryana IU 594]BAS59409.1 serine/threonine kinase with two-component sensor domain [Leptolyngbya boryana IAM M-101]